MKKAETALQKYKFGQSDVWHVPKPGFVRKKVKIDLQKLRNKP